MILTILTAKAKYPISFTKSRKTFVLSLHYNGNNSYLFVNTTKMYQFKAIEFELKDYILSLCNISKDFTINTIFKKTGLKATAVFSVDFKPFDTKDILDIHKY